MNTDSDYRAVSMSSPEMGDVIRTGRGAQSVDWLIIRFGAGYRDGTVTAKSEMLSETRYTTFERSSLQLEASGSDDDPSVWRTQQ